MLEVSFLWHLLNANPLLCGGSRRKLKASKFYSHVNLKQDNRNPILQLLSLAQNPCYFYDNGHGIALLEVLFFPSIGLPVLGKPTSGH